MHTFFEWVHWSNSLNSVCKGTTLKRIEAVPNLEPSCAKFTNYRPMFFSLSLFIYVSSSSSSLIQSFLPTSLQLPFITTKLKTHLFLIISHLCALLLLFFVRILLSNSARSPFSAVNIYNEFAHSSHHHHHRIVIHILQQFFSTILSSCQLNSLDFL